MSNHYKQWAALLTPLAFTAINAGNADAVLVYEFIQQGNDVSLTISGSLTGISAKGPIIGTGPSLIGPGLGIISTGNISGSEYTTSGPSNFGPGGPALMTYTGDSFNLQGSNNFLALPSSYIQGSAITGSGLFTSTTLAGLGLSATSGLLGTWTIGNDSIEVWAGAKPSSSPAAAPGPLPLLGAGAAFAASRRLRARLKAGSSLPQA